MDLLLVLPDLILQLVDLCRLHLNEGLLRLTHALAPMQLDLVLLGLPCGLLVLRLELTEPLDLHAHLLYRQEEARDVVVVLGRPRVLPSHLLLLKTRLLGDLVLLVHGGEDVSHGIRLVLCGDVRVSCRGCQRLSVVEHLAVHSRLVVVRMVRCGANSRA